MRTMERGLVLGILGVFVLAVTAAAQEDRGNDRTGMWGTIGVGYGLLDCSGCESEGGFAGVGRIGGTLSQEVRVGYGLNGWYKSIEGTGAWIGLASGQVSWYPGGRDLFVMGGLGIAWADCEGCDAELGAGAVIGVGYDLPLGGSGSLALTPFAQWVFTSLEDSPNILQFGMGITFN